MIQTPPLAKSYLLTYVNNVSNVPVLSEFVESIVAVSQTEQGRKLAKTTLANLEAATGALNSLSDQTERAKEDLYLLVLHPHPKGSCFSFELFK